MNATCTKCNGTGHISAFAHVRAGKCFVCHGTGRVRVSEPGSANMAEDFGRSLRKYGMSRAQVQDYIDSIQGWKEHPEMHETIIRAAGAS